MAGRLRARAVNLMRQLDEGGGPHRAEVERELEARLARARKTAPAGPEPTLPTCAACATANDQDARFCKQCGAPIGTRDKG
jgi:hypothetical protein